MTHFRKLFVVYDPLREEQPALERAASIAEKTSATLHLFVCIHSNIEKSADKSAEIDRLLAVQHCMLQCEVVRLAGRGIHVVTEVEWDKDWYRAVVRASVKCGADLVLKSSYKHSAGQRIFNRTSDWTLIRECLSPVMLVKASSAVDTPRVLAAVDICARGESYERLNQNVIDFTKRLTCDTAADVHFVNAFQDFKGVPNRQLLIDNCGIESEKIHITLGKPEEVIVGHARKLDVSLVVLGNSARSGISGALIGNTVEKVLDRLECDVLTMP